MEGPAGRGGPAVSLITEALQLRAPAPRLRGSGGESFPPLRRTPPAAKVLLALVLVCAAGVLAVWKGAWVLEKIETLAGVRLPAIGTAARPEPTPVPVPAAAPAIPEAPAVVAATAEAAGATAVIGAEPKLKAEPAAETTAQPAPLPEELQPMDVNLTLALIEDEKARQQLDEENQRKIEDFLRRMDVQGVCHQGKDSSALLDAVLVRPGDPVGNVGLTLKTIETRRLVFADRNGREYTKSY